VDGGSCCPAIEEASLLSDLGMYLAVATEKFKANFHILSSSVHSLQPVEGLKGIINNLSLWKVFLQCG